MSALDIFLYILGGILVTIGTLYVLGAALSNSTITFAARFSASVFCFFLSSAYGVFGSVALGLVGYRGLSQWTVARCFKWTMRLMTGTSCVISDPHNALATRPAVFVGNHQTELDVLMLGCMFPPWCSVTAKAGLKWIPVFGWFMLLSKTVFINRNNNAAARSALDEATRTMQKDRQSVFIFPEGTRSYTSDPIMLPFKKGAFHLAVQAQVPIVPVVAANYAGLFNFKRRIFNSGEVPVSLLKPISTKGLKAEDVPALTLKVQKLMEEELIKVTALAKKTGVAGQGEKANGVANGVKRAAKSKQ